MSRIQRRLSAERDLAEIWSYVAAYDPTAADKLLDRIEASVSLLASYPLLGRAQRGRIRGLRSFVVERYILLYRPVPNGVSLIRVVHGARDIGNILSGR